MRWLTFSMHSFCVFWHLKRTTECHEGGRREGSRVTGQGMTTFFSSFFPSSSPSRVLKMAGSEVVWGGDSLGSVGTDGGACSALYSHSVVAGGFVVMS